MALIDLVNDPYSAKPCLAEIGAYDIAGTATTTVRVIDHGLIRAISGGLGPMGENSRP